MSQTGVTFPVGYDLNGSYQTLKAALVNPTSPYPVDVIVDRQGLIAYMSGEYDPEAMRAKVEQLLR